MNATPIDGNDLDEQAAIKRFREARNKALREMDLNYARAVLPRGAEEGVMILALHKARYECLDLEPEYRHESARWLRERGYGRIQGELLPEGELPE